MRSTKTIHVISAHAGTARPSASLLRTCPALRKKLDAKLEVEGLGTLTVDTAFGGDSFMIVDARAMGFALTPDEAHVIAKLGTKITKAATEALGFHHPTNPDWRRFSFCLFAGQLEPMPEGLRAGAAVAIQPGKVDRSPTGTALSARM